MTKLKTNAANSDNAMSESERLTAVRDLIFGENMAEYQQEFIQIREQLNIFQNQSEEKLRDEITALNEKLDAMEHSFQQMVKNLQTEIDKNIEHLNGAVDDLIANRQEVGRAMAQIATTLQK